MQSAGCSEVSKWGFTAGRKRVWKERMQLGGKLREGEESSVDGLPVLSDGITLWNWMPEWLYQGSREPIMFGALKTGVVSRYIRAFCTDVEDQLMPRRIFAFGAVQEFGLIPAEVDPVLLKDFGPEGIAPIQIPEGAIFGFQRPCRKPNPSCQLL